MTKKALSRDHPIRAAGPSPAALDRKLIMTGGIGAAIAAICCATPLLVVVLGTLGLAAWAAKADYVLIPMLVLCLGLLGLGLYRRQCHRG